MCNYSYEDQMLIEDALRVLRESLYNKVGARMSEIKILDNGDVTADILIDEEGSVFHMEISNDGDRVVKEHRYMPDSSFISA